MKKMILLPLCIIGVFMLSCKEKKEASFALTDVNESINAPKVLFIVSNANSYGDSEIKASNHFAEIVLAYDEFIKAGYTVDFVSPEGGPVPVGF